MHKRERQAVSGQTAFNNETYLTTDSTRIQLKDTLGKSKIVLIESYFVGCMPCEQKYAAIKEVHDQFADSSFKIVLICDGQISSFISFKRHAQRNRYKKVTFLYDQGQHLKTYFITGYPTEFLIDNNLKILSREKGFGSVIKDKWLKEKKDQIGALINR